jgi:hypothetical protein
VIVGHLFDSSGYAVVVWFAKRWWEYVGPEHGGPVWRVSPTWDKVKLMNLLNAAADRTYVRETERYLQRRSEVERRMGEVAGAKLYDRTSDQITLDEIERIRT